MGLVDKIKKDVQKSGGSRSKFTYVRDGQKVRIRFLVDMDDGLEVPFHDSFERSINVPCRKVFGHSCPYCDDEDLRTRSQYVWSVWNYESKQVELFMFRVNNCSPIPALMAMYENFGTLTDRDYVISCSGKQMNKTFTVIPMDKVKFRNAKAKPYSKSAILKMIDKAWPDENDSEDYEDDSEDFETPRKGNTHKSKVKASKGHQKVSEDGWGDEEEKDYESMKPIELFKLCKERDIECVPKKPKKFYINLLEEWDAAQEDWGSDDDEEEDDWDDDEWEEE